MTQRNNYGLVEVNRAERGGKPHVRASIVEDARAKEGASAPRVAEIDPESVLDNRVRIVFFFFFLFFFFSF